MRSKPKNGCAKTVDLECSSSSVPIDEESCSEGEGHGEDLVNIRNRRPYMRSETVWQPDKSYLDFKLSPEIFKDNSLSIGGKVKHAGAVVMTRETKWLRPANVGCRVEALGKISESCGGLKRKWVMQMGLGGLLNLASKQFPRTLCYWLMTRVDPYREMLITTDGIEFRFSKIQVGWVLGIRSGHKIVPRKAESERMINKICEMEQKYGRGSNKSEHEMVNGVRSNSILVGSAMTSRLTGVFEEHEEEEFKTMFLIAALSMVLCPTQSITLASDLVPTATGSMDADQYDWSALVLEKLMENVKSFAKRFYAKGFAGGCAGCSIFLAIFYLDRLNRKPISWGIGPRIRFWTDDDIKRASREDRFEPKGDFGKTGCVDVAYGEAHPLEARDKEAEWLSSNDLADEMPQHKHSSRVQPNKTRQNHTYARKRRKAERDHAIRDDAGMTLMVMGGQNTEPDSVQRVGG